MSRRLTGFGCPPKKGTAARKVLLRALSANGVTVHEALSMGLVKSARQFSMMVVALADQKGYDIRLFPCDPSRCAKTWRNGGRKNAYRLVGKMRWDGSYRSFVNPETAS